VIISAETNKHLFFPYLHAVGYMVYSIIPKSVNRACDRFTLAGAKNNTRNDRVLSDLIRTNQH
jgi:hypothetical protein